MKLLKTTLAAAFAATALATTAPADITGITATNEGLLAPNDLINWGNLGPYGTQLTDGTSVESNNGLATTISDPSSNSFAVGQQGGNVNGDFTPGANLLINQGPATYFDLNFASPVSGAGFRIDAGMSNYYTATLTALDAQGDVLGTFSEDGWAGSQTFIGVTSSLSDISKLEVSANPTYGAGIIIGNVAVTDSVPEPSTSGLVAGVGLLALGAAAKHRLTATSRQSASA